MNPVAEDILMHYGMPRRSGRYPYGSGDNPYQRSIDFLGRVEEYKKQGMSEKDIALAMKIVDRNGDPSTSKLRAQISNAKDDRKLYQIETAKRLREKEGLNDSEIGRRMGKNESTIRSMMDPAREGRLREARNTAEFIRKRIDEDGIIDVGAGTERELKVSKEKLNQALLILENEGYPIYKNRVEQVTNRGNWTTQKVICRPGTEYKDTYNLENVHSLKEYESHDGGETFTKKFVYPKSMDSNRLQIRYAEDGGADRDGLVELRRGVSDLSLGNDRYAQVRILVDDKKYIKGMAVYSDDLPEGVDVVFNTNKSSKVSKMDVLKNINEKDPDNPFGALIKENGGQSYYTDANGERQLSLINKRACEGDWSEWSDTLPSQFLSKQSKSLAKRQLALARDEMEAEYDSICAVNNPTVKKHLLEEFSNNCDAAAVHLKAAALPGQKYHAIIPVNTLKDNEVFAPKYENGTKVCLVRYPLGGIFEIPELVVNNKHSDSKKILGLDVTDAIAINKKVADQLSGADFDGDTVMVIPTSSTVKIKNKPRLKELVDFDPKMEYPRREGMKFMKDPVTGKDNTQKEMGVISNLITDMTLAGATDSELARAVRHSMVVIDAGKHELDYTRSAHDHDIKGLAQKYQKKIDKDGNIKYGGASTIISRSSGQATVLRRQGTPKVNTPGKEWYDPTRPEGALIYKTADDLTYTITKTNKRTGKVTTTTKNRTQKSTNMAEVDDAYDLVSPYRHPMELIYADHANSLKALANRARKEMVSTGNLKYDATARKTYDSEVRSLMRKLDDALVNAGREREANRRANVEVKNKKLADPSMKKKDVKKASQMAISKYREQVGSVSRRDRNIKITEREWEAIQAGAISENTLKKILRNTDVDVIRQYATPRPTKTLSATKVNKIKSMRAANKSLSDIAAAVGVSPSTVAEYLRKE